MGGARASFGAFRVHSRGAQRGVVLLGDSNRICKRNLLGESRYMGCWQEYGQAQDDREVHLAPPSATLRWFLLRTAQALSQ